MAVQFNANSKANHLGTYPGDASGGQRAHPGAAAGAGAVAGVGAGGLGRRLSSNFKNKVSQVHSASGYTCSLILISGVIRGSITCSVQDLRWL